MRRKSDGVKIIHGLGRHIIIKARFEKDGKTLISMDGFAYREGQFRKDKTNGLCRLIKSDGFNQMGWMKKGFLNGFAKYEAGGKQVQGLFDQGRYMHDRHEDIHSYNIETSILAQPIKWDGYIKY